MGARVGGLAASVRGDDSGEEVAAVAVLHGAKGAEADGFGVPSGIVMGGIAREVGGGLRGDF